MQKSRTQERGEAEVTIETACHVVRVQEIEFAGVRENEVKISEMMQRNTKTTNARERGSRGNGQDGVPCGPSAGARICWGEGE